MLHIVMCKTVVLVELHGLFWSSARSLIALLNMVDEMKNQSCTHSKCFYYKILTTD